MTIKAPPEPYRPSWQAYPRFVGNDGASQYIRAVLNTARLHHVYLFCGPEHVGKTTLANIFGYQLLYRKVLPLPLKTDCIAKLAAHPDYLSFSGLSYAGVEQVREVVRQAQQRPLLAPYRIIVLTDIDALTEAAMNALLKTFEESIHTLFLCTSSRPGTLLTTIRSRCHRVQLDPVPLTVLEAAVPNDFPSELRSLALQMSGGRPGLLAQWILDTHLLIQWQAQYSEIKKIRKQSMFERHQFLKSLLQGAKEFSERQSLVRTFLHQFLAQERMHLLAQHKAKSGKELQKHVHYVKKILKSQKLLEQNVHPGLLLEDLLLSYV